MKPTAAQLARFVASRRWLKISGSVQWPVVTPRYASGAAGWVTAVALDLIPLLFSILPLGTQARGQLDEPVRNREDADRSDPMGRAAPPCRQCRPRWPARSGHARRGPKGAWLGGGKIPRPAHADPLATVALAR
jgi:hypothetical protein